MGINQEIAYNLELGQHTDALIMDFSKIVDQSRPAQAHPQS